MTAGVASSEPQEWQKRLSEWLSAPQPGQIRGIREPQETQKFAAPSAIAPQFGQLIIRPLYRICQPAVDAVPRLSRPGPVGRPAVLQLHHHLQLAGWLAQGLEGALNSLQRNEVGGS